MAKKAFLVTFITTTRVVADVPENFDVDNCNLVIQEHKKAFDSIIQEARNNILENPENYIYGDNAEIVEDEEYSYGEIEGD